MGEFQNRYASVLQLIERRLQHPYLLQHLNAPVLDEDKLLLLFSTLDKLQLPAGQYEQYALTTSLLQVALDTHDLVSNVKVNEHQLKNRQLTVLAGVYYSGLYYKILADCNDVETIRVLAQAIKIINDNKINLYHHVIDDIDQLMTTIKWIESSLIASFAKENLSETWMELVTNFLLLKRLLVEKEDFLAGKTSVLFDALKRTVYSLPALTSKELNPAERDELLYICEQYMDMAKIRLKNAVKQMPDLNNLLSLRITQMLSHFGVAKTYVEEG